MPSYEEILQENAELRRRVAELEIQNGNQELQIAALNRQVAEQEDQIGKQKRQIAAQKLQIEELKKLVEELRRRGKRQAAPFSKGEPSADPKRPGRKAGEAYGQQATRAVPQQVDEAIVVECPTICEHCQGKVEPEGEARQYQMDLPEIRPRTKEFILGYGKCSKCGREVVGRHPDQTSQAFRVGNVQIGPSVLRFAAWLNKVAGLKLRQDRCVAEGVGRTSGVPLSAVSRASSHGQEAGAVVRGAESGDPQLTGGVSG